MGFHAASRVLIALLAADPKAHRRAKAFKDAINQLANVSNEWYPKVSAYVKR